MHILVVEDDEPLRALLQRGLREEGHVVDTLPDGRSCTAYLAATPYDAIVLDRRYFLRQDTHRSSVPKGLDPD